MRRFARTINSRPTWSSAIPICSISSDLADTYSEKDLEAAILRDMQEFILELGKGFAFIERQKRIVIDGKDFYIDLLFYHRHLRRLVAIELKIGTFTAADKGQMELYLRWLEKHETATGRGAPLGLILCADKADEQVELLQLDASGIRVASYLTELPPRAALKRKLHDAVGWLARDWGQKGKFFGQMIANSPVRSSFAPYS